MTYEFDRLNGWRTIPDPMPDDINAVADESQVRMLDRDAEARVIARIDEAKSAGNTLGGICDPGEEVLVFEPFYTNYNGFAAMVGVVPVPVTTRAEDGYHLPARAAIDDSATPERRIVIALIVPVTKDTMNTSITA